MIALRRIGDEFLKRREASILLVAIALMAYFQATTGIFFTESNIVNVSQYVAATAIIAAGQVLLLVSGEIDLSVGNVYTLAPFLMHYAVDFWGVPVIPSILLALVLSALIGLVNGFITVVLRVPSFVTTLGMLFLISGITLITSNAYPVPIPTAADAFAPWLGAAPWAEIIWALLIIAVLHAVLTSTRWGLHTIAVGGNLLGASEAGIRVGRIKIGNFMICSALGGFAGIIEAFRIDSIDPTAGGTGIMFAAVASAVIGGTALAGGSGTIIGALLGAVVLGVLRDGFNLIGVDAYTFDLIIGAAILLAMISNVHLARLRRAGRT
ncbi:ABC transporter permease [Tenggerimyces flavus]|uniref:ABC transporter permease n=1 Tax=Tenggerimyces flavus TaxID=1708749 RepID=A0ABV7YAJ2_9ACTN|nr:ABC transporter permease [Tenggerimyces flavus]MBM7786136.1 simple sugar transport system permease protein [Tenggerimyces flavus]